MPSRRAHQKSHNGCALCRKRRVKCDGALPTCRNCVKYDAPCSFLEVQSISRSTFEAMAPASATTVVPSDRYDIFVFKPCIESSMYQAPDTTPNLAHQEDVLNSLSDSKTSPASLKSSPDGSFVNFDIQKGPLTLLHTTRYDEELLNNYLTATYLTASSKPSVQEVYRTVVPQEALTHEYLMHAMLALSASHLMHTRFDHRHYYEKKARHHQHLALTYSLAEFRCINPTNCHALFGTAGHIAILAFSLQSPVATILSSPLDDIADFFVLVRGIQTVLHSSCFDLIFRGKMGAHLDYDWHPPANPLPDDVKAAFCRLDELKKTKVKSSELQDIYAVAMESLQKAFETYSFITTERGLAFIWAVKASNLYVSSIKRRDPMALVILAHYAVLLHSMNGVWWSEGRGARLVEAIHSTLPATWQPEIQWPRDIIQGKRSLSIAV